MRTDVIEFDAARLAKAITAAEGDEVAEIERIRDRAEQEIREAYEAEVSKFAAAAAAVVLASFPFVVAAVATAAAVAVVGVAAVVAGPVLTAAVAAARTLAPDVDEDAFALMVRILRESVASELIREAEIVVHNALVETRDPDERDQRIAIRDALDTSSARWSDHIERTAATLATAAVNEGVSLGAGRAARSGRRLALRWRTRGDNKVRTTHRRANGQTRGIGERFDVGIAKLRWPGDPLGDAEEVVNCRCVVVPTRQK